MNTTNQPRILAIARENSVTSHSPVPNRLRTLSVIDTGRNKEKNTSYTASLSKFIRSTTLTINFLPIISPSKLNYENLYHLRYFDDSAISRQVHKMGYKRIAGTPSREIKQHALQSVWKRQNQTISPPVFDHLLRLWLILMTNRHRTHQDPYRIPVLTRIVTIPHLLNSTLRATEVRRLKTALWSMKGWCLGPSVVPL